MEANKAFVDDEADCEKSLVVDNASQDYECEEDLRSNANKETNDGVLEKDEDVNDGGYYSVHNGDTNINISEKIAGVDIESQTQLMKTDAALIPTTSIPASTPSSEEQPPADTTVGTALTLQLIDKQLSELPLPPGMAQVLLDAAQKFMSHDHSTQCNNEVGLEQIEDGDGPDEEFEQYMTREKANAKQLNYVPVSMGLEQIEDGGGPDEEFKQDMTREKANDAKQLYVPVSMDTVNELTPPVPFNYAEFEGDSKQKSTKSKSVADTISDEELVYHPTREDIEGDIIQGITNEGCGSNRRGWGDIASRSQETETEDVLAQTNVRTTTTTDLSLHDSDVENCSDTQEANATEVEAYAVDEEVYDATPLEPALAWWKQKRARFLIGAMFVMVGALALALGLNSGSSDVSSVFPLLSLYFQRTQYNSHRLADNTRRNQMLF